MVTDDPEHSRRRFPSMRGSTGDVSVNSLSAGGIGSAGCLRTELKELQEYFRMMAPSLYLLSHPRSRASVDIAACRLLCRKAVPRTSPGRRGVMRRKTATTRSEIRRRSTDESIHRTPAAASDPLGRPTSRAGPLHHNSLALPASPLVEKGHCPIHPRCRVELERNLRLHRSAVPGSRFVQLCIVLTNLYGRRGQSRGSEGTPTPVGTTTLCIGYCAHGEGEWRLQFAVGYQRALGFHWRNSIRLSSPTHDSQITYPVLWRRTRVQTVGVTLSHISAFQKRMNEK